MRIANTRRLIQYGGLEETWMPIFIINDKLSDLYPKARENAHAQANSIIQAYWVRLP